MVVDLQRLSEALARTSPEESLRQDLTRIIRARKPEIQERLARECDEVARTAVPEKAAERRRSAYTGPAPICRMVISQYRAKKNQRMLHGIAIASPACS